jgi:hypothetical protein
MTPNLSIVPKKYHAYISPLRHIFLDAREDDSRAGVRNLNEEIAALRERLALLERDKDLLTDCYHIHKISAGILLLCLALLSFITSFLIFMILTKATKLYFRSVGRK